MRNTARSSNEGAYCGRAVHGVSNLCHEDLQQIFAHRSKDRPTPWAHLAARYGVNEIDLRQLYDAKNDNKPRVKREPEVKPAPRLGITARDARFSRMWNEGMAKTDIALALGIHVTTVDKMRDRLGLEKRRRSSRLDGWSEADAAYVLEHYIRLKGSATEVGRHLGRTRNSVIGFASRQGWRRYRIKRAAA
jgi:hypothetical protein